MSAPLDMTRQDDGSYKPGDTVPALVLWQPWASLMAAGAKTIETRGWSTCYRGPLLICAAKRKVRRDLRALLSDEALRRGLGKVPPIHPSGPRLENEIDALPYGQAVALVELYDCISTVRARAPAIRREEIEFGDYSLRRFAWLTRNLRRLKPFPVTGRRGLFSVTLPDDLEDWTP